MASIWRSKDFQFSADDGTPLNAGTIDFYVTGTSTRKNAYSDEALSTPIANQYTLDSDGRPADNIWISGRYRIVVKTSGGTVIADIDPVEDTMPASDFQDGSPTYATAVGGTATAITLTFSPTLTVLTDGMVIGWKWGSDTTGATTVNADGLGAKSLVSRNGAAIAAGDGKQNDQATARYNSSQNRLELITPEGMLYRDGNNAPARADVASAATLNLDTAGTNYANITGTTTVTAITLTSGRHRRCRCDGALPITTGASLIINGIASGTTITFAAGDTFEAWGEPSGVVRIVSITRVGGGADGLLSTTTASAATSADMTLPAGFRHYRVEFDCAPSDAAVVLLFRVSIDSGATFKAGASDYSWARNIVNHNGGAAANSVASDSADAQMQIAVMTNGAADQTVGRLQIYNPASTAKYKTIMYETASNQGSPEVDYQSGAGMYIGGTEAVNAIRFIAQTGTITGTFKLYGFA